MIKKGSTKLDMNDRMIIQACLHDYQSISQISFRLNKNKSTISRELHRNIVIVRGNQTKCNDLKRLIVCNMCMKRAYCSRQKVYYDFKKADEKSQNRRKSSRSKPKLTEASIQCINQVVTEGVLLGQSLHHIYISDKNLQAICCERTIRRLVYRGICSVKPHQLRRYVRFKHTSPPSSGEIAVRDIRCLINRTFKDFTRYVSTHKRLHVVEYDSVIGQKSDQQALLTITFPESNFQFGFLIKRGNAASCILHLQNLFRRLGSDVTKKVFPINLCDNGTEFALFFQLEFDQNGEQIHRCFYTNPYKATDKSHCERNHELIRYVLPKGKSLTKLTQSMVDDMFSHINSYVRHSKKDKTPYDLVKSKFGQAFLDAIHIRKIPNKKVKLLRLV